MAENATITFGQKSAHPTGNAPSGYFYTYVLSTNGHLYTKDDVGNIIDHAAGADNFL